MIQNYSYSSDLSLPSGRTSLNEETWIVCCLNSVSALERITNHSVICVVVALVAALVAALVVALVAALVVAADLLRLRWRPNICLRRCSACSVALSLLFPSSPPLPTCNCNLKVRPGRTKVSVPLWCSFFNVTSVCFHFSSQQELRFLTVRVKGWFRLSRDMFTYSVVGCISKIAAMA
jgi:hypothetical protein